MRIPRTRGGLTGLAIVVLGAWGALIPFVGPYFDYQIGTRDTWDWTSDRFLLEVLPGAVAVLGGLALLGGATRFSTRAGAWLALAAGLWFVVGPTVSMLWNDGEIAVGSAIGSTEVQVLEWLGFFYGIGALITGLAAYAIGMFTTRPVVAEPAGAPGDVERRPARRPLGRFRRGREVEEAPPAGTRR